MVLADFIDQGHFARHIRRMRALYAERSAAFVAAIRDAFKDRLDLRPEEGGLGMVARLDAGVDDVVPLSPWTLEAPGERGLIIGFADGAPEAAARETRRFRQALGRF
jgi:GntR family transcriptional regulator / MocR family aminotransferase